MSEKRKDNKGRILRTGESQRPNLTYQYRYTDIKGTVRYVYSPTLEELRVKEDVIQYDLRDGIDYAASEITVAELVSRYINTKRGLSQNSKRAYGTAVKIIENDPFGARQIRAVKASDAKTWFVALHDRGLKQHTIEVVQNVIRPAFAMAVEDDAIRKNPFKFKLAEIIPNDAYVRPALTKPQQEKYLRFIQSEGRGNYYDDIVILLGTGLRVSELYGLTKADVDMERRQIRITKQLCRTAERPYFITEPKTKSGMRTIPMSEEVYAAFLRVLCGRRTAVERFVDGYAGFLFLDKAGQPKVAMHLENYMRGMQKKYIAKHGRTLPSVTPHVLRHTFCTNLQQTGIDVKSLQYLMGHSSASVTLDVYSHVDYDAVEKAFDKAVASL